MPLALTDDRTELYYEEAGSGAALVFVHEFAGDYRSWEPQMRYFSRRYRCIAYNARGYPPSTVPAEAERYSQDRARDDIRAVLDHLGIDKAHIIGLSMGGFATLHFGLEYPNRALSLVVAGCGYGAESDKREQFQREAEAAAQFVEKSTGEQFAATYAEGPTRVQFQNKNPRAWEEFRTMLAEHSLKGAAMTLRGVQKSRPSLFELEERMKHLAVPTLIITGDEDEPCLIPNVFMKRTIPSAALVMMPNAGHTINLEDPEAFNAAVADFLAQVTSGRWPQRDPRALSSSILGVKK